MSTILVTRPIEEANGTAQRLEHIGHRVIQAPMPKKLSAVVTITILTCFTLARADTVASVAAVSQPRVLAQLRDEVFGAHAPVDATVARVHQRDGVSAV